MIHLIFNLLYMLSFIRCLYIVYISFEMIILIKFNLLFSQTQSEMTVRQRYEKYSKIIQ